MNLSITFNWPPPDKALVSFGMPSVDDLKMEFRVGVIPKDQKDKIFWFNEGWFHASAEAELQFGVERGDIVVVERRAGSSEEPETRNRWDTDEMWPAEAKGATSVSTPWWL